MNRILGGSGSILVHRTALRSILLVQAWIKCAGILGMADMLIVDSTVAIWQQQTRDRDYIIC